MEHQRLTLRVSATSSTRAGSWELPKVGTVVLDGQIHIHIPIERWLYRERMCRECVVKGVVAGDDSVPGQTSVAWRETSIGTIGPGEER